MCVLTIKPLVSILVISLLIETFTILRQEVCRCIAGQCCPLFRSHDISFVVLSEKAFGFLPMLRYPLCRDIGR